MSDEIFLDFNPGGRNRFGAAIPPTDFEISSEDGFDALLFAWAAREAFIHQWPGYHWPDLIGSREDTIFPIGNVNYRWPRRL